MSEDIFGQVKEMESQAAAIEAEARREVKAIRRRTEQAITDIEQGREQKLDARKEELVQASARTLKEEKHKLVGEFETEKARLTKVRDSKVEEFARLVVERTRQQNDH